MPLPNNEGFDHQIHTEVDITQGARRVHALLSPEEAQFLLSLVDDATFDESSEISEDSLRTRLGYAAGGQDAPQSGDLRFYQ